MKIKNKRLLTSIPVMALIILLFLLFASSLQGRNHEKEREALESALENAVTYCYVMEGAYPKDIESLRETVKLHYDEDRFYIDYRYHGGNILPEVTILEKGEQHE